VGTRIPIMSVETGQDLEPPKNLWQKLRQICFFPHTSCVN